MIQMVLLLLVILVAINWKLALMIGVFIYYFGIPF
jgi:uncharacterized membrane protein YuzA (DUF378 family)